MYGEHNCFGYRSDKYEMAILGLAAEPAGMWDLICMLYKY